MVKVISHPARAQVEGEYEIISVEAECFADLRRYKEKTELPDDPIEATKIKRRALSYVIENGLLYNRYFGGPLLLCLFPKDDEKVMEEAHQGVCSAHQGTHTLVRKLVIQGYYYSTMVSDCIRKVVKFSVCQAFSRKETRSASFYTPVMTPIPFSR